MAHSNSKASAGQIIEIVAQLGSGRISPEQAQAIIEGRYETFEKSREQSGTPYRGGPASDLLGTTYKVPVSYALRPKAELDREFDRVSPLFDGRAWERHNSCIKIDETAGEREFFLAEVPKEFLGKRIVAVWDKLSEHFDKLGYRFAIEVEAIALAKAHPELQRKNYILALGSSALNGDGSRCVACLDALDGGRSLGRYWVVLVLNERDRLLLVRK